MLGVIEHPALAERLIGLRGAPSECQTARDTERITTAATTQLDRATIYATTPDMFAGESRAGFDRLSRACRFRVFGGDCYAYGLLARGFADAVCEAGLRAHDFMALIPVVEGAGGVITDWRGAQLSPQSGGEVLATANPTLHRAALAKLAGA